jgi:hypothetical protein
MAAYVVGGIAYLKVNGEQYLLRGDLMISPDRYERKEVIGQDGMHGYTETPHAPSIKATLTDRAGLSIAQFENMTDVTVTAEELNGKTYVLRNAFTTTARQINTAEGSFEVTWVGMACEEMVE